MVIVVVDICIQLSTLICCLAGQINNNNNRLSNELRKREREKERKREREKIPMNLEVIA